MTTPNHDLRKQVLATMIEVGAAAREVGQDAWKAIETTFPGTPADVIAEAWVHVDMEATERWWQSIERMVDVEIAQRAIEKVSET